MVESKLEELNSIPEQERYLPKNMLLFTLNNLNGIDLEFLINIKDKLENYNEIKFKLNEGDDSRRIEYSFSEMAAIIVKLEELTSDIPQNIDEANKFYKIYSRLTQTMTYDHKCITKTDEARKKLLQGTRYTFKDYSAYKANIRRNAAGLYGGLVDGKAICAGYALILKEALKYVGIKSQYISGNEPGKAGHAWNQVRIDGKWYNADPTWDSKQIQTHKQYKYMLLNDDKFNKSHGKFLRNKTLTYYQCKSTFDYNKIHGYIYQEPESEREI